MWVARLVDPSIPPRLFTAAFRQRLIQRLLFEACQVELSQMDSKPVTEHVFCYIGPQKEFHE
jgi:hypothetical protein